ncbi:Gfo/Idh/MocA family oxidoreductase [Salibacter sp.]|uniref:Gfo/Idh/MocA family protein n=1 Tax=Salibacter sp. TaxID=2010995 RepID=UPI00287014C9|nr:Gfo/Idh/MocA family oxidoreductase [Salibacter sp.]MDR9487298.1 Gfo/Idh/MocA family oxidoreductase [Salibacter sp.]
MSQPIRFGIMGCGYIAQRHLKHIIDHPGATAVGLYDTFNDAAQSLENEYQVPCYTSLDAFLGSDCDMVVICTPNGTHADLAIKAMKAGKHVLVEKPMATSVQDAQKMVDTAKELNRFLYVVKQNRYNPPVQAVKKIIDNNKLGELQLVSLNCYWNRNEAYYKNSDWKGTKKLDGGVLYTQFSHFIDILYYFFGDIDGVNGYIGNLGHHNLIEFEDTGSFNFKVKSGGVGNMSVSTCAFNQNMEGSITIIADNGTIKIGGKYLNTIDYQQTDGFDIKHLPQSSPANNYGFYQGSMSNHDKVIDNVVEALNGEAEIMTTADDGLQVVKMIDQFYKSAKWIS